MTTVSSAHYGLSNWLKALGLTDKDVTIKNMDQAQALGAFDNGIGDAWPCGLRIRAISEC